MLLLLLFSFARFPFFCLRLAHESLKAGEADSPAGVCLAIENGGACFFLWFFWGRGAPAVELFCFKMSHRFRPSLGSP